MTRVVRLRQRERAAFEQKHGVKLTYMPFIAASAIEAVRQFPIVNSSLIENSSTTTPTSISALLWRSSGVDRARRAPGRNTQLRRPRPHHGRSSRARPHQKSSSRMKPQGRPSRSPTPAVFGGEFGTPILNQPKQHPRHWRPQERASCRHRCRGGDTIAIRSMQTYCLGFRSPPRRRRRRRQVYDGLQKCVGNLGPRDRLTRHSTALAGQSYSGDRNFRIGVGTPRGSFFSPEGRSILAPVKPGEGRPQKDNTRPGGAL